MTDLPPVTARVSKTSLISLADLPKCSPTERQIFGLNKRIQTSARVPKEFPGFIVEGFTIKVVGDGYTVNEKGLIYKDFEIGTGPLPLDGQELIFQYTGYNESGLVIDSSYKNDRPAQTRLGVNGLIPGFEEGIRSMKAGGKRRIIVPPELGPPTGPATFFSAKQCEASLLFGREPTDGAEAIELLERVPTRAQQLAKLRTSTREHPFDLLIVGGGATGSGVAVDAVTRGLCTALVEREDFGSGTSSKSTKLVHGGVRYLEKAVWGLDRGQLSLVFEALHERSTLLRNAAHLAQALPIITPCYAWWEVPYYWAGLKAYDLVAGTHGLVMSRFVSAGETSTLLPTLTMTRPDGASLKGSVLYHDGQFDDSRLNVALACTAAAAGAVVANYVECKELIKNAEGKVMGARVQDCENGDTFEVHARQVVNATGPFSDAIRCQSDPESPPAILPSSGAHVTLPAYYGSGSSGLLVPKTKDGRIVFLLPWLGHMIAGTTDTVCEVTPRPMGTEEEVSFILATLSEYLAMPVRRSDVTSVWSGIRPLAINPRRAPGSSESTSRDHLILDEGDGMITIAGGKWTTYRKMAEDVVDAAVASGRMPLSVRPCVSESLHLLGAQGYSNTLYAQLAQQLSDAPLRSSTPSPPTPAPDSSSSTPRTSTPPTPPTLVTSSSSSSSVVYTSTQNAALAHHLAHSYGDRATRVLRLAQEGNLAAPLCEGHPMVEAEVVYCCRHEYCTRVEDFVSRRCRIAFLDVEAARSCLPRVAGLMAGEHGWSSLRTQHEISAASTYLDTFVASAAPSAPSAPNAQAARAALPLSPDPTSTTTAA
ncbi:MAG: hypothetical protein WDW36_003598 [Sanguina aurantia]